MTVPGPSPIFSLCESTPISFRGQQPTTVFDYPKDHISIAQSSRSTIASSDILRDHILYRSSNGRYRPSFSPIRHSYHPINFKPILGVIIRSTSQCPLFYELLFSLRPTPKPWLPPMAIMPMKTQYLTRRRRISPQGPIGWFKSLGARALESIP
jgi:hypothetical protein